MLRQIIAHSIHLIHTHGIGADITIFPFLLRTEGRPLALWRLACFDVAPLHDVDFSAIGRRALRDATEDGEMCLAGHRRRLLEDLLVRGLVDDATTPVLDLHRRLQGHGRVAAPHIDLALTLDLVRSREGCRTCYSTCVVRGLAPACERLGHVGIAEQDCGLRASSGCGSTLITLRLLKMAQTSLHRRRSAGRDRPHRP